MTSLSGCCCWIRSKAPSTACPDLYTRESCSRRCGSQADRCTWRNGVDVDGEFLAIVAGKRVTRHVSVGDDSHSVKENSRCEKTKDPQIGRASPSRTADTS